MKFSFGLLKNFRALRWAENLNKLKIRKYIFFMVVQFSSRTQIRTDCFQVHQFISTILQSEAQYEANFAKKTDI